ncbi:MAG: hypothetical protein RJA70_32 [Pseudomonadota bacterium]|jgi:diaminopimelate epimerase
MIEFEKYQGLGNDFVVVEVASAADFSPRWAQFLCDRHFGVGADGVLLISPPGPNAGRARARMTVLNSDGSEPEMCGNGLRCAALHLARKAGERSASFTVATGAGELQCDFSGDSDEAAVQIGLGQARDLGELRFTNGDEQLMLRRISMGNPHAVLFGHEHTAPQIDELGPQISAMLPGGANIEFVTQVDARTFRVIVWERGVGRTLACGTGAAATAAAAILAGRAQHDRPLEIQLPGGSLEIVVRPDWGVSLKGPARHVFGGSLKLPPG